MKTILTLLMLCSVASADTYEIHATAVGWTDLPSCGAALRMLRDRHEIRLDFQNDRAIVNGLRWSLWTTDAPGFYAIDFHDDLIPRPLVSLEMRFVVDDRGLVGQYTLYGVLNRTKDGYTRCADTVEIRGDRL